MNVTIPFTKDIKFNTNVSEILSISLEHDYTLNEGELLGNFTITGDYKTHEVSVNKEHFEYVLPFSVDITNNIDRETLDFEIDDFTYELIDNNTLRVNIEYSINAIKSVSEEKTDSLFIKDDEDNFDELLDEAIERVENNKEEEKNDDKDDVRDETFEENIIMANSKNNEETFVTYQIYIMKENDTLESICTKYNTTENNLKEYNDLDNLSAGVKIVIPDLNE